MKLLLFFPRCDRTGAELALHRLIHNANRTSLKMAVACGARGALAKTFPRDVPVFNYWHALSYAGVAFENGPPGLSLANSAFKGIIRLIHARVKPDAWYINTTFQPQVLALAREMGVPCILHTHEFEFMTPGLSPRDIENMITYPKLIIAASYCAANSMRVLGRQENMEVCYGSIDCRDFKIDPLKSTQIRRELRVPADAFVWAMSGSRCANKNPIGFVRIAAEVLKHEPNSYFLWVGGADTGDSLFAKALSAKLHIGDKIAWVPERGGDYLDHLDLANGFVLTSRNESFSLATLEATALGKPFVSFDSGGPREIFRAGMGVVVDSWHVRDMVCAMLQVMRGDIYVDPAISKARASEFDVSVIAKHWEKIIQRYMGD